MSGPKVVRIVTREELIEICRGLLARVDSALADWRRIGARNDCLDEGAIAAAERRREELAAEIAAGRFANVQRNAPLEETFLRADIQNRLAAAADRESAKRSRDRRRREAGKSLISALERSGVALSDELIRRIATGDESALSLGFAALNKPTDQIRANRELATKLAEGAMRQSFASWLDTTCSTYVDPEFERLDARISECEMLTSLAPVGEWRSRLEAASTMGGASRSLHLDALAAEIRRAIANEKDRISERDRLSGLLSEAEVAGISVGAWRRNVDQLDAGQLRGCATEIRSRLDSLRAERAAIERRAAVLEALAKLGYEVREDMATAWADNGQLVIANPSRPGYGMEVRGGVQTADRIQMRAVVFESADGALDAARDRDAETLWCGDVGKLRERLAEKGADFAIERALEIGTTPLKRIRVAADDSSWIESGTSSGRRTRPNP